MLEKIFCEYCDGENDANAESCRFCGATLKSDTVTETGNNTNYINKESPGEKLIAKLVTFLVSIVLMLSFTATIALAALQMLTSEDNIEKSVDDIDLYSLTEEILGDSIADIIENSLTDDDLALVDISERSLKNLLIQKKPKSLFPKRFWHISMTSSTKMEKGRFPQTKLSRSLNLSMMS